MPKKTKEGVEEETFDWENIPLNRTEQKTLNNAFKDEIKVLRLKMKKFVKENYQSIYLQYDCLLNCDECLPIKVIECWIHNNEVNNLQKNGIKDVDTLINYYYKELEEKNGKDI